MYALICIDLPTECSASVSYPGLYDTENVHFIPCLQCTFVMTMLRPLNMTVELLRNSLQCCRVSDGPDRGLNYLLMDYELRSPLFSLLWFDTVIKTAVHLLLPRPVYAHSGTYTRINWLTFLYTGIVHLLLHFCINHLQIQFRKCQLSTRARSRKNSGNKN